MRSFKECTSKNLIRIDFDEEDSCKEKSFLASKKSFVVGTKKNLPKKKNVFYCLQDQVLDSERDGFSDD